MPAKAFGRFVARFPFAGRLAIRPAYRNFRHSDEGNRTSRFAWLSKILGLMVLGHGWQSRLGIIAIKQLFLKKISAFWLLVFVGYTAANVAVTIAQATLLMWATYVYFGNKRVTPGKANEPFSGGEVMLMLVVTLGGQLLFAHGEALYR